MKSSVPPRMVALLALGSLLPLGAQSLVRPPVTTSPVRVETHAPRSSGQAVAPSSSGKATVAVGIPRAIPVARKVAYPHADLHREPVSFHPITVRNGPQPYVVDTNSLQKGLALIAELYRKSGMR